MYHDIHTWCLFSLYSAKSTELLHSPPVYESDIDTRDHDFYDYAEHPGVQDDDFYYVSWEDPIYDVFEDYDYSGMYLLVLSHSRMNMQNITSFWITYTLLLMYVQWSPLDFQLPFQETFPITVEGVNEVFILL